MARESEFTASPVILVGVMLGLAVLDLGSAMLAKEWVVQRHPLALAGGAFLSLALFAVLAFGLRYADLSTVTFGWVVVLQVGIVLMERARYGIHLSTGKWFAVVGLLLLQAYLILAPSSSSAATG